MRIESVRIQCLRGYLDQTIPVNDYTCLVGPNGCGKSTILCALSIFFRDTENFATNLLILQEEDFHCRKTEDPIKVTVTFTHLSAEAQEDFKDYYRQEKLVISAVANYDSASKTAEVKQTGMRLVMKAFSPFFAAEGDKKSVAELKELYKGIREKCVDLPAPGTKAQMMEALRLYEETHPDQCELMESDDQFYGVSNGSNRLAKYVQWVYVPAVKDAATEQTEGKTSALGKLLARTVRSKVKFKEHLDNLRGETREKYQKILDQSQGSLAEISESLKKKLSDWAHPDARVKLEWRANAERSIKVEEPLAQIIAGEGGFDGELSRFGHGLQRCYLLALLQELSGNDDMAGPRLILGCEEPELHQHPPQARHLADVLYRLSTLNSQVIVSTHSPYFVSGERVQDVRLIRKDVKSHAVSVSNVSLEHLAVTIGEAREEKPMIPSAMELKMQQALLPSLNELFFTRVLVLVEGLEDVAYITCYLNLLNLWQEFRRQGCHLVSADSKSHMLHPLAVAKHLQIPAFAIFDSDGDKPDNKSGSRKKHELDNTSILRLRGYETQSPFPDDTFWAHDTIMWKSEIGIVTREELGDDLLPILEKTRVQFGQVTGLDKTALFISAFLTAAWESGLKSSSLEQACRAILTFARNPISAPLIKAQPKPVDGPTGKKEVKGSKTATSPVK